MTDVVITGAARSAMGGFQGMFSDLAAADLGGAAIRAARSEAGTPEIDELLMGHQDYPNASTACPGDLGGRHR